MQTMQIVSLTHPKTSCLNVSNGQAWKLEPKLPEAVLDIGREGEKHYKTKEQSKKKKSASSYLFGQSGQGRLIIHNKP